MYPLFHKALLPCTASENPRRNAPIHRGDILRHINPDKEQAGRKDPDCSQISDNLRRVPRLEGVHFAAVQQRDALVLPDRRESPPDNFRLITAGHPEKVPEKRKINYGWKTVIFSSNHQKNTRSISDSVHDREKMSAGCREAFD